MAFVKIVKNKAYFKRFQVKYRRRREGKTNYRTRRKMVVQDKNKYNAHKHRFVVRVTSTRVICQISYSTVQGDMIVASADSRELKNYGIFYGLTNYAAAYATGLLVARRLLVSKGLDKKFLGISEATGEDYHVEENIEDRRPFKCFLDIGLVCTTTGNRAFGAMKGGCDGGLHIPHNNKRFPGYKCEEGSKEGTYDAEVHRGRIFGLHVANYMKELQEEQPEKYERQFSRYIKKGIDADSLEEMYKEAHKKIRENPLPPEKKPRAHEPVAIREGPMIRTSKAVYRRDKKLTLEERKQRVYKKMAIVAQRLAAEGDEEED